MGSVSRGPSSSSSSSSSSSNPIAGIASLAAAVISVWAVVCAARIVLSGVVLLFDALTGPAASASLAENLVMSGIAGVFSGVAIAMVRAWPKKAGHTSETFVSALFSKGLAAPTLDGVFWERFFIGGIIGLAVGILTGACGAISFLQPEGGAASILQDATYPIVAFLGGGFGGPGGTGFWAILFLILVIILTAVLVGFFAGVIVHLSVFALAGMVKGTTKAMTLQGLEEKSGEPNKKPHPIQAGMIRGMLTGLLNGVVEAIFTAWGVLNLPAVPPR
jgi:hypothetical protein